MPRSLITGSPWRGVLFFSIPLLIGNVVQQLYQFADAVMVGRHLGVQSLAAVGSTNSLMFLLLGFAWGMCSGFAIPTARAYGAGDNVALRRSIATGTLLVAAVSLVLTVAAPLLAERALRLLQTPAALIDDATTFAQVNFLGISVLMFFNYLAATIRATGDSRTPLIFLTISCVLNVGLVVLFIGPLGLGVGGAALATVVAQTFSVALCLDHIRRRVPALQIHRADWRTTRAEITEHVRLGLPTGFQASIIAIGSLAVQIRLNSLGTDAVAAYTTAARVDALAVALLQSLGLAMTMFVAQNLGARRPDRILQGVRQALCLSIAAALVIGGTLLLVGRTLIELFVGDGADDVVTLATSGLYLNACLYSVLAVLFVLRGSILGLGRPLIPTLTGVAELTMRLVTAVGLGSVFGYAGVIWGTPLAWAGALVLLVPAYVSARRSLTDMPPEEGLDLERVGLGPRAAPQSDL
jgi:putative MATE family efflux protein